MDLSKQLRRVAEDVKAVKLQALHQQEQIQLLQQQLEKDYPSEIPLSEAASLSGINLRKIQYWVNRTESGRTSPLENGIHYRSYSGSQNKHYRIIWQNFKKIVDLLKDTVETTKKPTKKAIIDFLESVGEAARFEIVDCFDSASSTVFNLINSLLEDRVIYCYPRGEKLVYSLSPCDSEDLPENEDSK